MVSMSRLFTWRTEGAAFWMNEIEIALKRARKARSREECELYLGRIREALDKLEAHQERVRQNLPSIAI
jgi:hypothetical protein